MAVTYEKMIELLDRYHPGWDDSGGETMQDHQIKTYFDYSEFTESSYLGDIVAALPIHCILQVDLNTSHPIVTNPTNKIPSAYSLLIVTKTAPRFKIELYHAGGTPMISSGDKYWLGTLNTSTNDITWQVMDTVGSVSVTAADYNNINFWLARQGTYITTVNPTITNNIPKGYGLIVNTVLEGNIKQIFYQRASGTVHMRSGDTRGWEGNPNVSGTDAWDIIHTEKNLQVQQGAALVQSIPVNHYKSMIITFPRAFKNIPKVIPTLTWDSAFNFIPYAVNITTTQFELRVHNKTTAVADRQAAWTALNVMD